MFLLKFTQWGHFNCCQQSSPFSQKRLCYHWSDKGYLGAQIMGKLNWGYIQFEFSGIYLGGSQSLLRTLELVPAMEAEGSFSGKSLLPTVLTHLAPWKEGGGLRVSSLASCCKSTLWQLLSECLNSERIALVTDKSVQYALKPDKGKKLDQVSHVWH